MRRTYSGFGGLAGPAGDPVVTGLGWPGGRGSLEAGLWVCESGAGGGTSSTAYPSFSFTSLYCFPSSFVPITNAVISPLSRALRI
jgi:hypothetical protein